MIRSIPARRRTRNLGDARSWVLRQRAAAFAALGFADAEELGRPILRSSPRTTRRSRSSTPRCTAPVRRSAAMRRVRKPCMEKAPRRRPVLHIWGVDTSMRDVARRYAKAGYAAIVPDLYARFERTQRRRHERHFGLPADRAKTGTSQVDSDIAAAAAHLKTRGVASTAISGFCMGGHLVLEQAIDNARAFRCCCPFYGAVEGIDPARITIPVCGSYGGRDTSIPEADVRAFQRALKVPNDIKIYPDAGHAFFDDQRKSYNAAAAHDAWNRTWPSSKIT